MWSNDDGRITRVTDWSEQKSYDRWRSEVARGREPTAEPTTAAGGNQRFWRAPTEPQPPPTNRFDRVAKSTIRQQQNLQ